MMDPEGEALVETDSLVEGEAVEEGELLVEDEMLMEGEEEVEAEAEAGAALLEPEAGATLKLGALLFDAIGKQLADDPKFTLTFIPDATRLQICC